MQNIFSDVFKFFNDIFKFIFSGWTLFLVAVALFMWLVINIGNANSADRELNRQRIEACYNAGMVLVSTDAGPRCATPQSLIKIK
jgi:hypothetical protein